MDIAQRLSSMILGLRRKVSIKVRQPLSKIMVPVPDQKFQEQLQEVASLILTEVNVKEIEYLKESTGILVKKIKPNFKTLGPKYGKLMKQITAIVTEFTQEDIAAIESQSEYKLKVDEEEVNLTKDDVEIISEDIPGWLVANDGKLTVALDITITEKLHQEGIAREIINRIQNLRKDSGLEVTDKIHIRILNHAFINEAIHNFKDYIGSQTLAKLELVDDLPVDGSTELVLDDTTKTLLQMHKI
jgi:isoleucyl-tRNA synthetase